MACVLYCSMEMRLEIVVNRSADRYALAVVESRVAPMKSMYSTGFKVYFSTLR